MSEIVVLLYEYCDLSFKLTVLCRYKVQDTIHCTVGEGNREVKGRR